VRHLQAQITRNGGTYVARQVGYVICTQF